VDNSQNAGHIGRMQRHRRRSIFLAGAFAAVLASGVRAKAACEIAHQADVPVQVAAGVPVVGVQVNGVTLPFVLDTGAQRSLITDATVQRAAVRLDVWADTTVKGISGYERHRNADPASLTLGGITLRRRTVAADSTLTVGPLPQSVFANHDIAGLLGADFLGGFDLDLDMPHGKLSVYRVSGCTGRFLPWPGGYEAVAATAPIRDVLTIPIELDGVPLRAEIDSGSSIGLLTATGISRMGLSAAVLDQDPGGSVSGVGRFAVATHRHHFDTLQIGAERISAPVIWAAPVHVLPIVDMLLGSDWLRQRRVWFSYATSQIFVATGG
jgi:Aspartyl protease